MGVNNAGLNLFAGSPPLHVDTTGRVFFVCDNTTFTPGGIAGLDDTSYGDNPQRPFATLAYAKTQCTTSRGDTIIALAGHSETLSAALQATYDTDGVKCIFLKGATWGTPAGPIAGTGIDQLLAATYYEAVGAGSMHSASANLISASAPFSSATWTSVGTHSLFTVSGMVHVRLLPYCVTSVTGSGANLSFGISGDTSAFLAYSSATGLTTGDLWVTVGTSSFCTKAAVFDRIISSKNIGYAVIDGGPTAGNIKFLAWWEPVVADSKLSVTGTGASLT